MTISFQREELHRIIDQLDEKWLDTVHGLLKRKIPGKKPSNRKDHWNAIRTKVQSFTHLVNNWDGYGAIPLSLQVADASLLFLKQLPEPYIELLEPQNITPSPYSTLTLDWENEEGNFVSIEIGKNKANFFAQLPGSKSMENDHLNIAGKDFPEDLLRAFQQLFPSILQHP